ncbi:MAG: hypothetical protein IPK60_04850 [Sandaracinaceae bacterium]|nr:hypothetical protein [Sandaracinaceae bacterium]
MIRAACLGFAFVVFGCGGGTVRVSDPRNTFSVELLGSGDAHHDGSKLAWTMPSEQVTVTAQQLSRSDDLYTNRSLDQVMQAIVTRYARGDAAGELHYRHCTTAGRPSYCLDASAGNNAPSEHLMRIGFLVDTGSEFLLVESIGPRSRRDRVQLQSQLLNTSLQLSRRGS